MLGSINCAKNVWLFAKIVNGFPKYVGVNYEYYWLTYRCKSYCNFLILFYPHSYLPVTFFCDIGINRFTVSFILGPIFVIARIASFAVIDRVSLCCVCTVYFKCSYTPRQFLNLIKWQNTDSDMNAWLIFRWRSKCRKSMSLNIVRPEVIIAFLSTNILCAFKWWVECH